MKHLLCAVLLLSGLPLLSGCSSESGAQEVPRTGVGPVPPEAQFYSLNQGEHPLSGSTAKQTRVITTQEDYATALKIYTATPPTNVDFSKGKVLLVDMGARPSSGYGIAVTSVDVMDNAVVANVELLATGTGCVVLTLITNPYQFVYIPTTKEVLVSEKLIVHNC